MNNIINEDCISFKDLEKIYLILFAELAET